MNTLINNEDSKLFTIIYPKNEKETIILLHGGPGFPSDFTETIKILSEKYQVIIFYQRGTKKSPCQSNNYSIERYISDIDCITNYFKINKFHIFGHSWGGLYAQIYAEQKQEKILSLFLCCSGSGTGYQWKQTEKEVMEFNKSKCTLIEWFKMGINNLLGMFGSDKAYQRMFKQVIKKYNKGFLNIDTSDINFDNICAAPINKTRNKIIKYPLLKTIDNSNFKVSIIYGENDIYQESKDFVIKRYSKATIKIIENCGHLPWLHNPQIYTETLKRHFQ